MAPSKTTCIDLSMTYVLLRISIQVVTASIKILGIKPRPYTCTMQQESILDDKGEGIYTSGGNNYVKLDGEARIQVKGQKWGEECMIREQGNLESSPSDKNE